MASFGWIDLQAQQALVRWWLAEAQRALGQAQGSAASAARAREIIDRLAATVPDKRLRATFLQSAKVQRVAALAGA